MWWGLRDPGDRLTDMDRLLLSALRELDADLCPGCGLHRADTMNPLHDRMNPDHTGWYDAGLPWTCLACAAKERAAIQLQNTKGLEPQDLAGLQWSVELRPRATAWSPPAHVTDHTLEGRPADA